MITLIMQTARAIADELVDAGAQGVVLFGSHARGDAHAYSDIDLLALGEGPAYQLLIQDDQLVALSWRTIESCRESFTKPLEVGSVIPGWRGAVLLRDPVGAAAELQQEAQQWTWDRIEDNCAVLVAEEITGLAEEVHKLVGALGSGQRMAAAVQRNVLTLRMASLMGLCHHLLYETENRLWNMVATRMGPRWAAAQQHAFGLSGEPFTTTCEAALELYALAAGTVLEHLNERQRAVVTHACAIAGHPLESGG